MTDLALFDLAALAADAEPDAIAPAGVPERFTLAWHHPDDFDAAHEAVSQRQRRNYDDDLATRYSGMWRRDAIGVLRHLQDETIGAHRLWLGCAVIPRRQVGVSYDEERMPRRVYAHGPEARLVRGLCHGCGWDRIEWVAPLFRRGRAIGPTWRSAGDVLAARFREHAGA